MQRKRALGRQQRIGNSKRTVGHRSNGWDDERGSLPSTSAAWYINFGGKSLRRHWFLPKTNHATKRRRSIRPTVVGVFLKMIVICAAVFVVSLTLPKLIFDAARYLTMSRPTVLYGSPTDWKDVAGCLSRTHRRDVRDYLNAEEHSNHRYADLPLNPDVVWNWSRYSLSSHAALSPGGASGKNDTEATGGSIPHRRLLIAQYSGIGLYQKLLQEVEPINRAYAKRWGHDYTTLVGTALKFPGLVYGSSLNESASQNDDNTYEKNHRYCRYYKKNDNGTGLHRPNSSTSSSASSSYYEYEAQSTFNKIPLLFKAMDESPLKYDQVLILDSDTMIVDFEYDITSLLLSSKMADQDYVEGTDEMRKTIQVDVDDKSTKGFEDFSSDESIGNSDERLTSHPNKGRTTTSNHDADSDLSDFLVAYRVWKFDWASTWDVNAGISLWNLHHPSTRLVAEDWLKSSLSDPKQVLLKNDDQYYLQRSLQKFTTKSASRRGVETNAPIGVFGMRSFRSWWKRHTFLPALLDYYGDSTSSERGGSKSAGNSVSGYDNHFYDGVGIRAVREEFEYYNATLIKHFKRDKASWSRTGIEQRLLRIREAKVEICRQWPNDCLL